ncbi:predicted protein [Naegleria gruberi]|uniref:Predicted protein n=1 Tax=Naegleria gruberi TaxID=5762 RepID=D2VBG8_NAEGR|nr:uncharacterized protein NAEGRDRAFT_48198 [Naegleria gruberi]EFC45794.1 predicted protein [Naegleria gruberi]|eukprot:XP_002678538.1 predicted protein [Naegleria gruberi strain NEG-M]
MISSLSGGSENQTQNMVKILESFAAVSQFFLEIIKKQYDGYAGVDTSDMLPEEIPRLIRLAKYLELKDCKEFIAFSYIFTCQSSNLLAEVVLSRSSKNNSGMSNIMTIATMSIIAEMSTLETLSFLSPNREHIQQGIIIIDSGFRDSLSVNILKMPRECINALVKCPLTPEEFLKIDKTKLADVLLEESTFELPGIKSVTKQKGLESSEDGNEEDLEDIEIDDDEIERELALLENGKEGTTDNNFNVYEFIQKDKSDPKAIVPPKKPLTSNIEVSNSEDFLSPYKNDIEYLDDRFKYLCQKIRLRNVELDKMSEENEDAGFKITRDRSHESIIRELKGKCRLLLNKIEKRSEQTKNNFIPRLEKLAAIRGLDEFEKWILTMSAATIICLEVTMAANATNHRANFSRGFTVGYLLWILCDDLEQRMACRSYFYKKSKLILDGMIRLSDKMSDDLMECYVDMDRRMLDYLCNMDFEFSQVVEGSHLFFPKVKLENVVLPDSQKSLIVDTVANYERFKKARLQLGFEDIISYGNSIVIMFYGESGTGKTMMANALANHLNQKLLLVNFSNMTEQKGEVMKYVFRESKINNALLFFDECESFFESRKRSNSDVTALLTEIEKFDGLIILATNKQYELDEAMHRRITLAIEFKAPDPLLRRQIWEKHIPPQANFANVDWESLSQDFELTGGLIKNAILSALTFAISRDSENPVITHNDLVKACQLQLKGHLKMGEFEKKIIPKRGLPDLILSESLKNQVKEVIQFEKSRKILFNLWGFDSSLFKKQGTTCLIVGHGTGIGKSLCAEVISYEIGKAMKVVDINELLTKYSFHTTKNVEALFKECKELDAILVLEMSTDDSSGNQFDKSIKILLNHLEHYEGAVIVITSSLTCLDSSLIRRFKFVLNLPSPSLTERKQMWQRLIPEKVPKNITMEEYDELAEHYSEFSGGNIENCIFRACSRTAFSSNPNLSFKLLRESAEEELKNCGLFISQAAKSSLYF